MWFGKFYFCSRRSISANAVSVNSQKVSDEQMYLEQGEYILQIGKRKFAKIKGKRMNLQPLQIGKHTIKYPIFQGGWD